LWRGREGRVRARSCWKRGRARVERANGCVCLCCPFTPVSDSALERKCRIECHGAAELDVLLETLGRERDYILWKASDVGIAIPDSWASAFFHLFPTCISPSPSPCANRVLFVVFLTDIMSSLAGLGLIRLSSFLAASLPPLVLPGEQKMEGIATTVRGGNGRAAGGGVLEKGFGSLFSPSPLVATRGVSLSPSAVMFV